MKLPTEVWSTIAASIPRGYLDALVTENRTLSNRIRATYEPDPEATFRRVYLEVCQPHGRDGLCVFMTTCNPQLADPPLDAFRAKRVHCDTAKELSVALRNTYVQYISYSHLDDTTSVVLGQHAHRWRSGGQLYGNPGDFPDAQLFERFYNELTITTGTVALELPQTLQFDFEPARFWHLESVRRCKSLRVVRLPAGPGWTLTAELILQWLSITVDAPEKRLRLHESTLAVPVTQLLDDLIAHFIRDDGPPTAYTVKIFTRVARGYAGTRANETTQEQLRVSSDIRSVTVKRSSSA